MIVAQDQGASIRGSEMQSVLKIFKKVESIGFLDGLSIRVRGLTQII